MEQGGRYYFYHNDHLGTPMQLTSESGAVVWSAKYDSFGKATVDASSTVINNLRFPGQYYDEETGLHYNFHRYYDTGAGRYTRQDPIGIEGDLKKYLIEMYKVENTMTEVNILTQQGMLNHLRKIEIENSYIHDQGSVNLYGYVSNNPVISYDETGEYSINQKKNIKNALNCIYGFYKCLKDLKTLQEESKRKCEEEPGSEQKFAVDKCWNGLKGCIKLAVPGA